MDATTPNLIRLSRLAREIGRPFDTVRRWAFRGCRGVRLQAVRVGGVWHSTVTAVLAFQGEVDRRSAERVRLEAVPVTDPAQLRRDRAELVRRGFPVGRVGRANGSNGHHG